MIFHIYPIMSMRGLYVRTKNELDCVFRTSPENRKILNLFVILTVDILIDYSCCHLVGLFIHYLEQISIM